MPIPMFAGHDLEVRHLQAGIDGGGERELAIDRDRVRDGGRVVDGDGVTLDDPDDMVGGRDGSAPGRGIGPASALHGLDGRAGRVLGEIRDVLRERDGRDGDGPLRREQERHREQTCRQVLQLGSQSPRASGAPGSRSGPTAARESVEVAMVTGFQSTRRKGSPRRASRSRCVAKTVTEFTLLHGGELTTGAGGENRAGQISSGRTRHRAAATDPPRGASRPCCP